MAAAPLASLALELTANIAGLEANLNKATRSVGNWSKSVEKQIETAGKAGAAALGAAIGVIAVKVNSAIGEMAELAEAAARVGSSAQGFNQLKFAVEQSGGSVQALETGLRKLSQQMADAAGGGTAAKAAFDAIGVSVTDANGKLRDSGDVFNDVADRFKDYADGAGEVAIATKLFGRSGTELLGTLNAGSDGIAEFAKQLDDLGGTITNEATAAADQYQDNLAQLGVAIDGLAITLATDLLPSLLDATEGLIAFVKELRADGTIDRFVDGIKALFSALDEIAVFFVGKALIGGILAMRTGMVALGAQATLTATAMGVLRGGLTLLGGPAGVIALAAIAMYKLSQANVEAEKAAQAHQRALDEINGVAKVSETAALDLAKAKRAEAFESLNVARALLKEREAHLQLALAREEGAPRNINAQGAFMLASGRAQSQVQETRAAIAEIEKSILSLSGKMFQLDFGGFFKPLEDGAKKAAPPIIKTGEAAEKAAKGYGEAGKAAAAWAEKLDALRLDLAGPIAQATAEYEAKLELINQAHFEGAVATEQAVKWQRQLAAELAKTTREYERQLDPIGELIERISGMTVDRAAEDMLQLRMALDEVADPALRAQLEALIVKVDELALGIDQAATSGQQFGLDMKDATNIVRDAFDDLFASGLSGWDDMLNAMSRSAQQQLRSISRMFQQTVLTQGGGGFQQFGQNLNQQSMFGQGGTGSTMGGWANAASTAYAGWQAAEQGDFWGATLNGAATGATIGGVWGAVIGAIVGALAYVVAKPDPPEIHVVGPGLAGAPPYANLAPGSTYQSALGGFTFASIDEVPADARNAMAAELQKFDQVLASIIGPGSNLDRVIESMRTFNLQLEEGAISAENMLEGRFLAVLGNFSAEIQAFVLDVEKIEEQVQRLGDALAIEKAIQFGDGLGLALGETLDLVSDLTRAGETAGQVFTRLRTAVQILDHVALAFHATFDGTRQQFIEFGNDLVEVFGGVENLVNTASAAFAAIFSPLERAEMDAAAARRNFANEIDDIGLGPDATAQDIAAVVRRAIETGNDVLLKEALEAGAAFGRLAAALEALARASDAANNSLGVSLGSALGGDGTKPGTNWIEFFGVEDGPPEGFEELSILTESAGEAALEAARGTDEFRRSLEDLQAQINAAVADIQRWLDAQRFSDTSTLTPMERLAEAQRQFDSMFLAAQAGDLDALRGITGIADTFLREGRNVWGDSQAFADIERRVRGQLEGIVANPPQLTAQEETAANTAATNIRLAGMQAQQQEGTAIIIAELRGVRAAVGTLEAEASAQTAAYIAQATRAKATVE